jgi:hypothetical protein
VIPSPTTSNQQPPTCESFLLVVFLSFSFLVVVVPFFSTGATAFAAASFYSRFTCWSALFRALRSASLWLGRLDMIVFVVFMKTK